MRVVMLSTDSKVFEESAVARRIASYGEVFEELLFVVFAVGERKEVKLAPNVRAVAVGGSNKFLSLVSGFSLLLRETYLKKYDVISSQDPFALGVVGLLAAKLRGCAFQAQLHTDCFSPLYASESLRRKFEVSIARFVIASASGVRVVSERLAHAVRPLTQKPVTILPLPLSPRVQKNYERPLECEEGVFTVLSVARFTKEKQLHLLIEATELVPNMHLVLMGEGSEKEFLSQIILNRGLSKRVFIVPWRDPASYYAHADAFALASRYEGYGLAIMEAALFGLPIVVTDVGVAGYELKSDMDILITEPSAHALALTLARLRDDSVLREVLGSSARKKAEATLVPESEYRARYKAALVACTQEQTYTAKI